MCGIIGYTGRKNAVPVLISGLHSLEYRGYDSAGIAVMDGGAVTCVKAKGRIANVESLLESRPHELSSHTGIGHTRWATHGAPSDENSHPHGTELVYAVHTITGRQGIQRKHLPRRRGSCAVLGRSVCCSRTGTESFMRCGMKIRLSRPRMKRAPISLRISRRFWSIPIAISDWMKMK